MNDLRDGICRPVSFLQFISEFVELQIDFSAKIDTATAFTFLWYGIVIEERP